MREVCDNFYSWLKEVGVNSSRASIIKSCAEKVSCAINHALSNLFENLIYFYQIDSMPALLLCAFILYGALALFFLVQKAGCASLARRGAALACRQYFYVLQLNTWIPGFYDESEWAE
jgi:hypothetical protein